MTDNDDISKEEQSETAELEVRVQHLLHLVRFDLMQFVNGLHQYIMARVSEYTGYWFMLIKTHFLYLGLFF